MKPKPTYVLYALNRDHDAGGTLSRGIPLYFSSLSAAMEGVRSYREEYAFLYSGEDSSKELLYLILDEMETDRMYPRRLSCRVFSPEGEPRSHTVYSEKEVRHRPPVTYRVGEIVEAPFGERLGWAIVAEPPAEDMLGLIAYPSMELDYVFSPLVRRGETMPSQGVAHSLREALEEYRCD